MHKTLIVAVLLSMGFSAHADSGLAGQLDCDAQATPYPLPVRPSAVPAVSHELQGAGSQLGAPRGALALYSDERQSVDRVLMRLRAELCRPTVTDPGAGYVRRTEHDNAPYRFNAQKGFTAAEFDAWMRERGIRIVNGRAVVGGAPEAQPASTTESLGCSDAAGQAEVASTSC